jgi:hypothetical protein
VEAIPVHKYGEDIEEPNNLIAKTTEQIAFSTNIIFSQSHKE